MEVSDAARASDREDRSHCACSPEAESRGGTILYCAMPDGCRQKLCSPAATAVTRARSVAHLVDDDDVVAAVVGRTARGPGIGSHARRLLLGGEPFELRHGSLHAPRTVADELPDGEPERGDREQDREHAEQGR